jgi:hypothetical protein
MGIIINIDDVVERMWLGKKITFDSLDFIADQFGDCIYENSNYPWRRRNSLPRSVRSSPDWRKL